jgi:L-amino acid N-acyltransferase YncA
MSGVPTARLRDAEAGDMAAVARVYAHWVESGLASFEYEAPDQAEMARRWREVTGSGFPFLVVEGIDGRLQGYAYAAPYRNRPGYRFTCEDSVYVARDAAGHGVGRSLLAALIGRCEAMRMRLMVAVIGDSANEASIGLHASAGFTTAGVLPAIGWKHGRWIDSVLMTRPLGEGAASAPE